MAFHAQDTSDSQAAEVVDPNAISDASGGSAQISADRSQAASPAPQQEDEASDFDSEAWYQKRLDEMVQRASGLVTEAQGKSSNEVEEECPAGETTEPAAPQESPDPVTPMVDGEMRPRSANQESPDLIAAIRKVSASSASEALGLHALKQQFTSAWKYAGGAALALGSSFLIQLSAGPESGAGFALALAAWFAGTYCCIKFSLDTRRLSQEYRATVATGSEQADGA